MYTIIDSEGNALYVQSNEPINGELFTEIPLNNEMVKPKLVDGIWIEMATPEVPQEVAKANFKLAMIDNGISTSMVDDYIDAMPTSLEKDRISILWYDTNTFERKNETLNAMSPIFNISKVQLDNLFILANTK